MRQTALVVLGAVFAAGCGGQPGQPGQPAWGWDLPDGVRPPAVPAENPMTREKVELGRLLFYDARLSRNGAQSCASCHEQRLAFTDGRARPSGSTHELHRRNSPSLANVAWASSLTWANPLINTLERQVLLPLLGETPVELGFGGQEVELLTRLEETAPYPRLFAEAFPEAPGAVSLRNLTFALAAFQRTLISLGSAFDRYQAGDGQALTPAAKRGLSLFNSERLECYHCHSGFLLADSVMHEATSVPERLFHNTGLYDVDGAGAYPPSDTGLLEITGAPDDMGRFRTPSLRNVGVTAPYMHDGSLGSLDEVIDAYAAGGRARASTGVQSRRQSELVRGFDLSPEEREDLKAFLMSLTDDAFLSNPAFGRP